MTATLIVCRGLPASGKSSWAREFVKANKGALRVNRDDLRMSLHEGKWSRVNEKVVVAAQEGMIRSGLSNGLTVIVDDTNLVPSTVDRLERIAAEFEADWVVKDFTDVSMSECVRRAEKRTPLAGEGVVRRMWEQHLKPPPRLSTGKPGCVIVDVDGTLATMVDRGPFEWDKVSGDELNPFVLTAVKALERAHDLSLVVVSGRDGCCYSATEAWLFRNGVPFVDLFMRAAGDGRPDYVVKREILYRDILPKYDPVLAIDDRQTVVDMWREEAIMCWQVDSGRF